MLVHEENERKDDDQSGVGGRDQKQVARKTERDGGRERESCCYCRKRDRIVKDNVRGHRIATEESTTRS